MWGPLEGARRRLGWQERREGRGRALRKVGELGWHGEWRIEWDIERLTNCAGSRSGRCRPRWSCGRMARREPLCAGQRMGHRIGGAYSGWHSVLSDQGRARLGAFSPTLFPGAFLFGARGSALLSAPGGCSSSPGGAWAPADVEGEAGVDGGLGARLSPSLLGLREEEVLASSACGIAWPTWSNWWAQNSK